MNVFLVKQRIPHGKISAPFKKLVFILIDAMRFDFINSLHYRQHLPFVSKLMGNGHGVLYKSQAKAPTVTLPRLKVSSIYNMYTLVFKSCQKN